MEWQKANLILFNGNIITMDGRRPYGSAMAIHDDRIFFVGGPREALSLAAPGATIIDLQGRAVLPGLIDNHCHFMQTGYAANDIEKQDQLPIRVEVFYQTRDVAKVVELGLPRIGGCILIDGSFGSRTAALLEPYADDPENYGYLYFDQEELNLFVEEVHTAGLQLAMHVIGDRGIEMMLCALETVLKKYPRPDHRHRIEHFELPTPEHIERARELELVLSVQPAFEFFWGGADNRYGERLGPKRVLRTNPLRTMVNRGLLLAGGSDSAVTPMDIILAIHAAVNHPNKQESLEVYQAIKMFTIDGAKALFRENDLGSISPGKQADMIVLAEDPCFITARNLKDINVDLTIVAGKIVCDREGEIPLFDLGA
jgi:predicted amidohydrolase YtcJ